MASVNHLGHPIDEVYQPYVPKTLEELLDRFPTGSTADDCMWRGQANLYWTPFPTLYRRIRGSGYSDMQINEGLVRHVESGIVEEARANGPLRCGGSVLEFMARMQHYGGATRLLDVTSSLDVALYFASSGHDEVAGVVYSYRVNPDMRVSIGEQPDGQEPDWYELTDRCRGGRPLLVKPQSYEPRIVVQHGAFIMTSLDGSLADPNLFMCQTVDSEVRPIWIPPKLKPSVRRYLAAKGTTEESLFPSGIEGFSKARSANVPVRL